MARKKDGNKAAGTGNRKLQKAQQRLVRAQEMYAEAETRGERAIKNARAQASAWREEAAARVERRTGAVQRAEEKVLKEAGLTHPAAKDEVDEVSVDKVLEADDVLESSPQVDDIVETVPDDAGVIVLAAREATALRALRAIGGSGAVTAQAWRATAGMSGTTFGRAREALLRYGLVVGDGPPSRTTKYSLSDSGTQFDLADITTE